MKNKNKLFNIITLAVIISFITAGCPKDDDPENGNENPNKGQTGNLAALTGTVNITISGIAQVGNTLTTNTSNLEGSGTIKYQWKRADTSTAAGTNISGATSQNYILSGSDVGKYIKVTVTRSENSGSITSTAIGLVHSQDAVDSTSKLSSVTGAATTNVTDGSRTGITKIDASKLDWMAAAFDLSLYKDKNITVILSVDVKREGAAGTLMWQINNNPGYPTVASQNNAAKDIWHSMSGTWKGIPNNTSGPVLYLNNDKTSGTTFYYIDNLYVTIVPTDHFDGETLNSASNEQVTRKINGYDYELWNQNKQGTASMTIASNGNSVNGGTFKCNWSGIENALFRAGRKYDKTKTHSEIGVFSIEYDATEFTITKDVGYLSVYGWVTGGSPDALIEYYIVESRGNYNPGSSGTNKGTVTIDGGTYTLYETTRTNQPSIEGNKTFKQYWSIRNSNRKSGTISVSEHFKAWADAGLISINNGKLYEVSLKVEGYQNTGSAQITKNILKINDVPIQ